MENIIIRHARPEEYDALLSLLDKVFGFPSKRTEGFLDLLPKLYKKEYTPTENNLVLEYNGELVGAVGMYERYISVGGEKLKAIGIGNVACREDMRGGGVMTKLMKAATSEIISRNADLSDLGGRRHRYGHFGYECAGRAYNFDIRADSVRHLGEEKMPATLRCVDIDGYEKEAEELYKTKPIRFLREGKSGSFTDVIYSWCADVVAILKDTEFCGYAVIDDGRVTELMLSDKADFGAAIRAVIEREEGDITITLHETDREYMSAVYEMFDGVKVRSNEQVSVIKHRRTAEVYLKYSASVTKLPDGELPLLIHGIAGDEEFTLSVKNGEVSVSDGARDPIELSQNEAVALLYGLHSPHRMTLPKAVESWLPLPLYFPSPDNV